MRGQTKDCGDHPNGIAKACSQFTSFSASDGQCETNLFESVVERAGGKARASSKLKMGVLQSVARLSLAEFSRLGQSSYKKPIPKSSVDEGLCEQFFHHARGLGDVGEALRQALAHVGQAFVIDAE